MSSEVAFLEIRVGAQGTTEARNRLKELTEQSERAEKAAQKLAAETERAEARKAAAVEAAAARADKAATTAAINEGRARQKLADDAAKYSAQVAAETERAEARKAKAVEAAAAKSDKALTAMAVNEGKARERMATDAAKYAQKVEAAARKQEQTIRETGQKQYAEVKKWLMTEEEALRESYLRRRRIIESQGAGSQKQMDLAAMDYKYNQQLLTLRGSRLDSSKYAGTGPGMKSAGMAGIGGGADIAGMASQMKLFAVAAAAAAAAYKGVTKALEANAAYEKTIALLTTATGSAQNAAAAYKVLDDMENEMPASADQLAKAFTRLVNQGLTPSEQALRSYSNIAAATGSDVESVADKVANATMGNFRGLREMGVRAEEDGDKIRMTFKGVTTSIGNDSKSIQGYLINLGETGFEGATAAKMNTLEGTVHKLKNTWDDMFRDIGRNNIAPVIKEMASVAISSLESLREIVSGSWLSKLATEFGTGIRAFLIDARAAAEITAGALTGDKKRIDNAIALQDERRKAMAIEIQSNENEDAFLAALKEQNLEIDKQGNIVQKRADALAAFGDAPTVKPKSKAGSSKAAKDNEIDQLIDKLSTEEELIGRSYSKRQAIIDRSSVSEEIRVKLTYANVLTYEEEMSNTKAAKLKEAQNKEIADLEESLRSKEDIALAAYERQVAMVTKNVDDEIRAEALRTGLLQQEIDRRVTADNQKRLEAQNKATQKNAMFQPYMNEVEQIRNNERLKLDEYQKARDEDLISAQEHALLKANLYKKTEADLAAVDLRNKEAIAGNSAALFGNLAQVSKNLGGEQSAAYKGLFAMSKAFSIAQASMSIATGTAKALELGWPAGLAAGIQVAAQGAGLLAAITSSNYAGAYDAGGIIPAGRIGLVGERGPELVQGPAMVTGRRQTAGLLASGGDGSSSGVVTIINAPDTRGAYEFSKSATGERVFVNGIRRNASTIRQLLGPAR